MEQIKKIIAERKKHWDRHEESWNEAKEDYDIEEPPEVDELADQILEMVKEGQDDLPVDFIVESLTKLGQAPSIVYDDNGHFAVSGDGYQPVPDGKFEESVPLSIIVEPEQWFDTIREALKHYLNS